MAIHIQDAHLYGGGGSTTSGSSTNNGTSSSGANNGSGANSGTSGKTIPKGDRSLDNPSNQDDPKPTNSGSGNGGSGNGGSGNSGSGNSGSGNEKQEVQKIESKIEFVKARAITGTPGPGIFGLMLSLSDIEALIPKLQSASTELTTLWNNTLSGSIGRIENSWAGADAKVYTEKVEALDPQVKNMIQAIDLLAKTYQKVLDRSKQTITEVSQNIAYSVGQN